MPLLTFKKSIPLTIGVELEFQIVNPISYDLESRAIDLMRVVRHGPYQTRIKPELTQNMLEINTSIHQSAAEMYDELMAIRSYLIDEAKMMDVLFCGGGTHPFAKWEHEKIFPLRRFRNLWHHYRFLTRHATIFGQHIHVGCESGEDAIYLTNALARYIPQFIAISAASPFYQGVDTGYYSARSNVLAVYPLSGVMPYLTNWEEFSTYLNTMKDYHIVESMKDFYWDIRPKPELGTVEIRALDTPLTISKAVMFAAYLQSLSAYLLKERPFEISHDLYYLYNYNRFEASRYGLGAIYIDPYTKQNISLATDILNTLETIEPYAAQFGNTFWLNQLAKNVKYKKNDAFLLKKFYKQHRSFPRVVRMQCLAWKK